MPPFQTGILVLSDTCFADNSLDKTSEAVHKLLHQNGQFQVTEKHILPDKVDEIQYLLRKWTATDKLRLIVTCGGTGFTVNDVTPEAVKPLLEKEAPGIVHAMIAESLKKTPFAIMSRPVAGVVNKTLIITLPGSPRGATENLAAVLSTLPHALLQIANKDARALHKKQNRTLNDAAPNTGIAHHHHHDTVDKVTGRKNCGLARHELISNDLNAPVTQRARSSPYEVIEESAAYELIDRHTPGPQIVDDISILDPRFTGAVIAEDVYSEVNVPNFRASIVDGYAVVSSDGPGTYPVVSISHASSLNEHQKLKPGEISRVTTGAPVPEGADAVVMVEETQLIETTESGDEEKLVKILAKNVNSDENIRHIGSDLKKGTLVLSKGARISGNGGEVGMLASIGVNKVKVYRKPVVGFLSTGDELRDVNQTSTKLRYGEIYDSNRPTLISCLENSGYEGVDLGIAGDKVDSLASQMRAAFEKHKVDYLVTTGGVSMGEMDLLKPTIERVFGGVIHFGRVKIKPGKPTTFATFEFERKKKVIFALPGNPASSSVCFYLFVLPSMMKWHGVTKKEGQTLPSLPKVKVILGSETRLDPQRTEYQRMNVSQNPDGRLVAESTGFQRSSNIGSFKGANALVSLPSQKNYGAATVKAGSAIDAYLIGSI